MYTQDVHCRTGSFSVRSEDMVSPGWPFLPSFLISSDHHRHHHERPRISMTLLRAKLSFNKTGRQAEGNYIGNGFFAPLGIRFGTLETIAS